MNSQYLRIQVLKVIFTKKLIRRKTLFCMKKGTETNLSCFNFISKFKWHQFNISQKKPREQLVIKIRIWPKFQYISLNWKLNVSLTNIAQSNQHVQPNDFGWKFDILPAKKLSLYCELIKMCTICSVHENSFSIYWKIIWYEIYMHMKP